MEAFVIDALRTPVGKYGGTLSTVRPDDLAALTLAELVKRNPKLNPSWIEDVFLGAANQSGEDNRNVARMAVLLAGLPKSVGGQTVNRLCASGLQAIASAAQAVHAGEGDFYLAGGVESMSRAPMVVGKATSAFDRSQQLFDTTMGWRFTNKKFPADHVISMGETAENVAQQWNISREAQDAFALQSQQRYSAAHQAGKFKEELIAVEIDKGKAGKILFEKDEHPRESSAADLAKLAPAFIKNGTVTAGNSSGINDGAAALMLASANGLKQSGMAPMARVVATAVAGVEPSIMGIGPVDATRKALKRAGLSINDIGLVELNEAFASQSLACLQELAFDPSIVNVNGGAIAIGHPLGCSGARISATLLHEMKRRKVRYGLATMCIGVGQGFAVIYENC